MHDQTGDLFLVREVDLESLPNSVLTLQIQVIAAALAPAQYALSPSSSSSSPSSSCCLFFYFVFPSLSLCAHSNVTLLQ